MARIKLSGRSWSSSENNAKIMKATQMTPATKKASKPAITKTVKKPKRFIKTKCDTDASSMISVDHIYDQKWSDFMKTF